VTAVRALVASKDSAGSVGATVEALLSMPEVDEVLVVDDGSCDATTEMARAAGAWVLRLPANGGKGAAVAAGLTARDPADVYLLVDADLGATASGCRALLGPVLNGQADMTVGVLPPAGGRGGIGLVRVLAAKGISRACGFAAAAPLSGQRAVRGEVIQNCCLARRFGLEVGLTIDVIRAGSRVLEVPIEADHHHRGRSLGGFAHRGRQGIDIGRALWPRLTSPAIRIGLVILVTLMAVAGLVAVGGRRIPPGTTVVGRADKVLIIGVPGMTWSDLETMPAVSRLTATGSAAALAVRTRSKRPGITEAYATLGAGSRVAASDNVFGAAKDEAASDAGGNGLRPRVVDAVALRQGAGRDVASPPGTLGDVLRRAGRSTAVVGNADIPPELVMMTSDGARRPARFHPAAAALADSQGMVDAAWVSDALLLRDASAPFGQRADPDATTAAVKAALAAHDVVIVDPGDLTRVASLSDDLAPPGYRERALRDTDAIVARLVADQGPSTMVLVVSVLPPAVAVGSNPWALTPLVARGPGVETGNLYSAATRRTGLVALTDLAPTVLATLGVPSPRRLVGAALQVDSGPPAPAEHARLDSVDRYRQSIHTTTVATFVVFQLLVYGCVARWRRAGRHHGRRCSPACDDPGDPDRWREALRLAVIAVAAFPLATFLFRPAEFAIGWGLNGLWVLLGIDVALVAATMFGGLRRRARTRPLEPLGWIMAATAAVIAIDVALGGHLQLASVMGYHPQVAGRFYGIGNAAFAVLAGATLLAGAIHLEHAPRKGEALVSVFSLFALVAWVDGAPGVGDDVGGLLSLVPVLTLTLWAFSGRRITWKGAVAAVVLTVAALSLAAVADLARGSGQEAHLGRLVRLVGEEGIGPVAATISRKAGTSIGILGASPWNFLAPLTALVVAVAALRSGRPSGPRSGEQSSDSLLALGSPRRAGMVATLAVGFLGALVNDSGVVITALILAFVGVFGSTIAIQAGGQALPALLAPLTPPKMVTADGRGARS